MNVTFADKYIIPLKQYGQRAITTTDERVKVELVRKCFHFKDNATKPLVSILKKK